MTTKTETKKSATSKKGAAKKPAVAVVNAFALISSALQTRFDNSPNENQKDEIRAAQKFISEPVMLAASEKMKETDFASVAARITALKEQKDGYLCAKTIIKVCALLNGIATGTAQGDNFVKITVRNMLEQDNHLNIKEIQAGLTRKIARDDVLSDMRDSVKNRAGYTIGTANSQGSKVRKALAALGLAAIVERKKGDDAQLTEQGKIALAHYA